MCQIDGVHFLSSSPFTFPLSLKHQITKTDFWQELPGQARLTALKGPVTGARPQEW